MNNKDIDTFIRNIEILIPIRDDTSKRFLRDIHNSVEEYASNHEGCTFDDIVLEFGKEKDIALDYIESMDTDNLISKLTTAKYLRRLIAIVAVTAVASSYSLCWLHRAFPYVQYRPQL